MINWTILKNLEIFSISFTCLCFKNTVLDLKSIFSLVINNNIRSRRPTESVKQANINSEFDIYFSIMMYKLLMTFLSKHILKIFILKDCLIVMLYLRFSSSIPDIFYLIYNNLHHQWWLLGWGGWVDL